MNTNSKNSSTTSINYSADTSATVFHDIPVFDSEAFRNAADAFDFWVGQHTNDQRDAAAKRKAVAAGTALGAASPAKVSETTRLHLDMAMHLADVDAHLVESLTAEALIREVLEHTVVEVHALCFAHRGHYVAQMATRSYSDGTLEPLRFRVAHLLGLYVTVMPTTGFATGVLDECPEDITMLGWSNIHGDFLDVVTATRQPDDFVDADMAQALAVGAARSPSTFRGVRYLPLGAMHQSRFYFPDGTWVPASERSPVSSP